MLKRCIIHIGLHKTGSSSIQSTMHKNLKDHDSFTYAKLGKSNHNEIMHLCFRKNKKFIGHQKRGINDKELKQYKKNAILTLKKAIEECQTNNFIISAEIISSFTPSEVCELKKFFKTYFEKIEIYAFIRSPKSFIESSFQQRVKTGLGNFDLEKVYKSYKYAIEKFDICFGTENVHIYEFYPSSFVKNNVVLEFYKLLNIDIPMETIRTNDGLSVEAISLLYVYHKFGSGYGVGKRVVEENLALIKTLSLIKGEKIKFSNELISSILGKRENDLLWIEKRMGHVFSDKNSEASTNISSEHDLFSYAISAVSQLKKIIGEDILPSFIDVKSIQDVAKLVHILRLNISYNLN